jgi:chemotaxis protein MotB
MKIKFIVTVILAAGLVSCGTGKKLELAETQNAILKSEVSKLEEQNAALKNEVTLLKQQSEEYQKNNDQYKNELERANASRVVAEKRFNELSNCLEEQSDTLLQIKRKAQKDLNSYDKSNIKIKYQNGMVYISMQDEFMFPSGSTKINPGGMKALSVIAQILSDNKYVTAIVVGNTDTANILRGFKDNWSLSTERSNAIVRYLIQHYGVDPARLIAAGKSKYNPVASNSSPEGRALNRRTDIIINPDLKKLWLLSQKYP